MSKPKPIHRTCSHCGGKGVVEFTGVFADTLVLLRQAGPTTAADLAPVAGCKATAMSNRLAALEKLGLATSRRYGVKRLYQAKE